VQSSAMMMRIFGFADSMKWGSKNQTRVSNKKRIDSVRVGVFESFY